MRKTFLQEKSAGAKQISFGWSVLNLAVCPSPGLADPTATVDNMHIAAMANYSLRIKEQLNYVNEHSFNNFKVIFRRQVEAGSVPPISLSAVQGSRFMAVTRRIALLATNPNKLLPPELLFLIIALCWANVECFYTE